MGELFNRVQSKRRRQYLRRNMTKAEKFLWNKLRSRRLGGLKFRRQCGIGNYVVDFYCPEWKLAIEIDGDVHGYNISKSKDTERDENLKKLGIEVLRFTNIDVLESIEGVLTRVLSNHPPTPSLSKEGEI